MIELVTVIVLIGILAAVAIPRMDVTPFRERGFHDAVFAALTHARHVAIASRRFVCVAVTAGTGSGGVTLTRDPGTSPETAAALNCSQTLAVPAPSSGCASNSVCVPAGVTLLNTSTTNFAFDPQGRAVSAPNFPIAARVDIQNQNSVTMTMETGYIR